MIITENDDEEIIDLQKHLANEFEMKNLRGLKYLYFFLKGNISWIYLLKLGYLSVSQLTLLLLRMRN